MPALAQLYDEQGRELVRREVTDITSRWALPDLSGSKILFLHVQTPDGRSGGRVLRVE